MSRLFLATVVVSIVLVVPLVVSAQSPAGTGGVRAKSEDVPSTGTSPGAPLSPTVFAPTPNRDTDWIAVFYVAAIVFVGVFPLSTHIFWAYRYERDVRTKLIEYAVNRSLDAAEVKALVFGRPPTGIPGVSLLVFGVIGGVLAAIAAIHALIVSDGPASEAQRTVLLVVTGAVLAAVTIVSIGYQFTFRRLYMDRAREVGSEVGVVER